MAKAFGVTHAYTLAPLRRSDLAVAAVAHGVDPDQFIQAVSEAGAQALARTPLTLNLLLNEFRTDGTLPSSRAALYEFALPRAVMDQGEDRDPVDLSGSQAQRFAVATRLACYCLLTGAAGVTTDRQPRPEDTLLPLDTFLGVREGAPHDNFVIERPIVESVLHSPLFTSRGHAAAGPAHASIASYLTARYVVDHHIPQEQLEGLLVHRGDVGEPGIPGDLHELAAWLIALCPQFGPWLIRTDPEAIANFSSYIDDPHCRLLIVDHLLQQARDHKLRNGPWWYAHRYRLQHPGLTDQLRRALQHATASHQGGTHHELELALALISYNQVADLLHDVTAIALSAKWSATLRRIAVEVAANLDSEATGTLVKPILDELAQHPDLDSTDGLRGAVLEVCWPDHLTLDELLPALTPPSTVAYRGSYARFCQNLPGRLNDADIEPFMEWTRTHLSAPPSPPDDGTPEQTAASQWYGWSETEDMMQALLDRSLSGVAAEERIPGVAAWLRPYLRTYPQLYVPPLLCVPVTDVDGHLSRHLRRQLAAQLISLAQDEEDAYLVAEGWDIRSGTRLRAFHSRDANSEAAHEERASLLDASDLIWLLELERDLEDSAASRGWPSLQYVWALSKTTDGAQDAAWAVRDSRVWPPVFAGDFDAMPIHGDAAERRRSRRAQRPEPRQWEGYDEFVQACHDLLLQAEAGESDSFVQLCQHLRFKPDSGRSTGDLRCDLLALPGIEILPVGHEQRLRTAARLFLASERPTDNNWIGTNTFTWQGWAACLAFGLFIDDQETLTTLPPEQWRAWAPTLLAFPVTDTSPRNMGRRRRLLEHATGYAAHELEDTYSAMVSVSWSEGRSLLELDMAETIWSPALEERLLIQLSELTEQAHQRGSSEGDPPGTDAYQSLRTVLSLLWRCGTPATQQQVLARFGMPLRAASGQRDPSLDAEYLCVLLPQAPIQMWPTVENRLRTDVSMLDTVSHRLLDHRGVTTWVAALPTEAVIELARLLLRRYPPTNPSLPGPPGENRAEDRRDATLEHLATRGSAQAVRGISELAASWPQSTALRFLVQEAVRMHREHSWARPTAEELNELIHDPRRRLIKDGADLLALVLALLHKIQEELTQGTRPAAILWNETSFEVGPDGKKTRRRLRYPKDENLISDYLAHCLTRELAEGGVLINREVQINRNVGGAGDRIDLLLQAPAATPSERSPRRPEAPLAELGIEVKGNWHPKLDSAMETQLVDDYLPSLSARHGLYLVAYFPSSQWNAPEKALPAAVKKQTATGLQAVCDEQAAHLSDSRNLDVRALVLDCSLRNPAERNT